MNDADAAAEVPADSGLEEPQEAHPLSKSPGGRVSRVTGLVLGPLATLQALVWGPSARSGDYTPDAELPCAHPGCTQVVEPYFHPQAPDGRDYCDGHQPYYYPRGFYGVADPVEQFRGAWKGVQAAFTAGGIQATAEEQHAILGGFNSILTIWEQGEENNGTWRAYPYQGISLAHGDQHRTADTLPGKIEPVTTPTTWEQVATPEITEAIGRFTHHQPKKPITTFALFWSQGGVLHAALSEDVPRTADGFVDARALYSTPECWLPGDWQPPVVRVPLQAGTAVIEGSSTGSLSAAGTLRGAGG